MRGKRGQKLPHGQRHQSPDVELGADVGGWGDLQQGQGGSQEEVQGQVVGHAECHGVREDTEDLLPQDVVRGAEGVPGAAQHHDFQCLPVDRLVGHRSVYTFRKFSSFPDIVCETLSRGDRGHTPKPHPFLSRSCLGACAPSTEKFIGKIEAP